VPKIKKACHRCSTPYAADEIALDYMLMNRESADIVTSSVIWIQTQMKLHDPSFKASAG